MATREDRRVTYDDYLRFPPDERWEVIDGEAYMVPAPNSRHQLVAGELYRQVANYLKEHGGGIAFIAPLDVVLAADGDIVQPDLVFIADVDRDVVTEANVWGRPTWVVEVVSDPRRDRKLKLPRYERFGIPEYWIVDPREETVEVYLTEGGRYAEPTVHTPPGALRCRSLHGFAADLGELFEA